MHFLFSVRLLKLISLYCFSFFICMKDNISRGNFYDSLIYLRIIDYALTHVYANLALQIMQEVTFYSSLCFMFVIQPRSILPDDMKTMYRYTINTK